MKKIIIKEKEKNGFPKIYNPKNKHKRITVDKILSLNSLTLKRFLNFIGKLITIPHNFLLFY